MGAELSKPSTADTEQDNYLKDASLSIWERQQGTSKDEEQNSQTTSNDSQSPIAMTREQQLDRERERLTWEYVNKFEEGKGPDFDWEKSRSPNWLPECPWCGRANENEHKMCDPVHPRMCEGGDDPNKETEYGSRNSQYKWSEAREKLI